MEVAAPKKKRSGGTDVLFAFAASFAIAVVAVRVISLELRVRELEAKKDDEVFKPIARRCTPPPMSPPASPSSRSESPVRRIVEDEHSSHSESPEARIVEEDDDEAPP